MCGLQRGLFGTPLKAEIATRFTNFVQFAGTLSLALINNFLPDDNDTFTLVSFGSSTSGFANAPGGGRVSLTNNLASFAVTPGQYLHRGDTIGYVGLSGRSTGPHLHYEVRIHDTPVNPYKYLRVTMAQIGGFAAGS